jgi:hypothetical protein
MLIPSQMSRPNSYRLMKSPIARSCMCSVCEKQMVRRTNRLIRVRRWICLLSILLRLHLPNRVLLSGHMTLIRTPPVCIVPGDTKGRQQRLPLEKNCVLASSKHIRPHSTALSGGACHHASQASGGEHLKVEPPVACWACASLACPFTRPPGWARRWEGTRVYSWASPRRHACGLPWGGWPPCLMHPVRVMAFGACATKGLVTGSGGAARPPRPTPKQRQAAARRGRRPGKRRGGGAGAYMPPGWQGAVAAATPGGSWLAIAREWGWIQALPQNTMESEDLCLSGRSHSRYSRQGQARPRARLYGQLLLAPPPCV